MGFDKETDTSTQKSKHANGAQPMKSIENHLNLSPEAGKDLPGCQMPPLGKPPFEPLKYPISESATSKDEKTVQSSGAQGLQQNRMTMGGKESGTHTDAPELMSEVELEKYAKVERQFWQTILFSQPLYGSDSPGTLFKTSQAKKREMREQGKQQGKELRMGNRVNTKGQEHVKEEIGDGMKWGVEKREVEEKKTIATKRKRQRQNKGESRRCKKPKTKSAPSRKVPEKGAQMKEGKNGGEGVSGIGKNDRIIVKIEGVGINVGAKKDAIKERERKEVHKQDEKEPEGEQKHPRQRKTRRMKKDDVKYGIWNLSHLDQSLLNSMTQRIPGVSTPYLYFGSWKAMFAWHVEDVNLFRYFSLLFLCSSLCSYFPVSYNPPFHEYSINYLHLGKPKFWYGVSPNDFDRFCLLARRLFPDGYSTCAEFLRHKTFLFSPKFVFFFRPFIFSRKRKYERFFVGFWRRAQFHT